MAKQFLHHVAQQSTRIGLPFSSASAKTSSRVSGVASTAPVIPFDCGATDAPRVQPFHAR